VASIKKGQRLRINFQKRESLKLMNYYKLVPEIKFAKKEQIMNIAKTIGFFSGKKNTCSVTIGDHVYNPPLRKLCLYYDFNMIKYLFSKFNINENSEDAEVINNLFLEEFRRGEKIAIEEERKEYFRQQAVGTGG
jgi:hypothetical protein